MVTKLLIVFLCAKFCWSWPVMWWLSTISQPIAI
jgi:hypothetical protein